MIGSSSAEERERLPFDVVIEILFRLPVKDLLRFRCVSKQWFALLTCPSFKLKYDDDHINNNKNPSENSSSSSFLLVWDCVRELEKKKQFIQLKVIHLNSNGVGGSEFYSEFSFETFYHTPIEGEGEGEGEGSDSDSDSDSDQYYATSCHGLVCLAHRYFYPGEVYVINPSTMDLVRLPEPFFGAANLAIGFLPSTNEFKIVSFYEVECWDTMDGFDCEVLTLTTTSGEELTWRKEREHVTVNTFEFSKVSICIQGVIYWLGDRPWGNGKLAVLAFDLGTKKATVIRAPEPLRGSLELEFELEQQFSFFESGGLLGILQTKGMVVDAWILTKKEDTEAYSWIQYFRNVQETNSPFYNSCSLDREEFVRLLNSKSGKIQYCLHLRNKNKATHSVQVGSDDHEDKGSHLVVAPGYNKNRSILFSESFISPSR